MSRSLFLEYGPPERAYAGLTGLDRLEASRTQDPNPLNRLHYIRTKYVRRGSPYPLDGMLDLLFKGNVLRLQEGGKVTGAWRTTEEVDDTLVLKTPKKSTTLVMRDSYQIRIDSVVPVDEINVGYSCMAGEYNNLQKAFHPLSMAATSAKSPRCLMDEKLQYQIGHCQEYLRDENILVRRLLAAVHFTFGLRGCGTEIGDTKEKDGAYSERLLSDKSRHGVSCRADGGASAGSVGTTTLL
ncbi:hypothetical protein B0O99DRAFT_690186 [Bisporella sp. PMI_857]|nr:hypothetical protein B0O99DRAFT_690186 [Bisporella sp. PMI_857]